MRKDIHLNFDWYYLPDFDPKYIKKDASLSDFKKVMIPHTLKEIPFQYFKETDYQFIGSYVKHFTVEKELQESNVLLKFFGVMNVCEVFLNEVSLGIHEGGYTPFSYDISSLIDFEHENTIFVKVDATEISNVPPFGDVVDYLGYGGIYREVCLEIRPIFFIHDLFITTIESPNLSEEEMLLLAKIRWNKTPEAEHDINLSLYLKDEVILSKVIKGELAFESGIQELVVNIKRWTLDNPVLYKLELVVLENGKEIDHITESFGFRSANFTSEGFILNNKLVKLIGLNRHQSYPYVGYAMPSRMQARDAEILKFELGCNIVRTSHYMQSDHFIKRCDEVGLLVFEEIPGWQYIGDDHFKELSLKALETMIEHHFNHPSIVLWGVRINESADDHDFYEKTNELAYKLDKVRQTGGVRNMKNSEFLEDVYTYNDFSHTGDNPGLENPRKIIHKIVPYLVTEHNGHVFPTKKWDSESKRCEQALRHLEVMNSSFQYLTVSGAIGWCMTDYNTHKEFGSGDHICHHGVMDMFRIPKYASYAYASQQMKKPVLMVASNMMMGEYSKSIVPPTVIFTNCDYLKIYHNDQLVGTFYSDWEKFPYIPNAPVIIDDYIGDRILENESYSKKVAKKIKQVLLAYNRYGTDMPLKDKLSMANLMSVHKFTMKDAMDLYSKYIGGWAKEGCLYKYEGYMDDKLVATSIRGQSKEVFLKAELDDKILLHDITYDVTRLVVSLKDEFDNILPFASNVIEIETSKELQIIGPNKLSLLGGSTGIYLKTTGILGKASIRIQSVGFKPISLKLEIK
ncbi:MAG: glycoside hydrolase family 2 protein [Firmicutes bacterium]|nr:glycoside hydrolase family 2 protein [Bacillota bacterium]